VEEENKEEEMTFDKLVQMLDKKDTDISHDRFKKELKSLFDYFIALEELPGNNEIKNLIVLS
jgi:hypothetical protein